MTLERDEILGHDDYDGIQEYDNPLPRWWLWLFYAGIAFAVVYIPYYLLGFGPTTAEMYRQEMAAAAQQYGTQEQAAAAPAAGGGGAESQPQQQAAAPAEISPDIVNDAQAVAAGKEIFAQNCAPCHGPQGQGVIGPNLTDNYWLHGNTLQDLVHTITNGVPDKGMIAWKNTLNPQKIQEVAAYVYTLRGTNPPNPKPPQGKEYPQ